MLFETIGDVPGSEVRRTMNGIDDEAPAGPAIHDAFGGRVVVRAEFRERPGREFRKLFRMA